MTKLLLNKNILVADDDAINQFVVKHALVTLGANVDAANNGEEAVEKIKANDYALILMDIQMPGMTGYEATEYIRNKLKKNTPIVAMTAFALNGEEERCIQMGMNGYVSKPFTTEKLSLTIEAILNASASQQNNPYLLKENDVEVDITLLYEVAGNDLAYIQLMLKTFLVNMPNTLHKIKEAIVRKDWDEVYKTAHFAKSSLSIIKVEKIFGQILELEKNAKNKLNLDSIDLHLQSILATYSFVEKIIAKRIEIMEEAK